MWVVHPMVIWGTTSFWIYLMYYFDLSLLFAHVFIMHNTVQFRCHRGFAKKCALSSVPRTECDRNNQKQQLSATVKGIPADPPKATPHPVIRG